MSLVWEFLFGCTHRKTSRAFTLRRNGRRHTYIVCLACGREFEYDWERMGAVEREGLEVRAGRRVLESGR